MRNEFINDGAWGRDIRVFRLLAKCGERAARFLVRVTRGFFYKPCNLHIGTEMIMLQVAIDRRQELELERQHDPQQHNEECITARDMFIYNRCDGKPMRIPRNRSAAPRKHAGHANQNGGGREWRKDCPDVRRNVADVLLEWAGV